MIKKILRWLREGNDCGKCPCYWFEQGYEDCDEGCCIDNDGLFYGGCRVPRIIRWYKKRQAVFIGAHEYDGIDDWYEEQCRLDDIVASSIKDGLERYVICYIIQESEQQCRHVEVDQDACIHRLAHEINHTLSEDRLKHEPKTLRQKWAALLRETFQKVYFDVRLTLTI